ncbi:MAG: hypothetical protein Q7S82_00895 [bacterium]|nr:hypothetical protein [bacterium]
MPELSQSTQKLISQYQNWQQSLQQKDNVGGIHVDEVASAVAAFYERIRELLDWREEHLMKKMAIERVLKRRLLISDDGASVAEPLVLELIRGGHFLNDRIPEEKIGEVQKIIDKYIYILGNHPKANEKSKLHLYDWLLGMAACEIEETLSPFSFSREKALIEYMASSMAEKIKLKDGHTPAKIIEEEKDTQIYIAVQKALFKLDNPMITYNLFKRKYAQWKDLAADDPLLTEISKNIYSIWDGIEKDLNHFLADKFYRICERFDTLYLIMGDIISENPAGAAETIKLPESLEKKTAVVYQQKLATLKSRMRRAAIYATLSIFITKILMVLAVEVPLDRYLTQQFSYFNLGLNILIPPLLMFFLVLLIKLPPKDNLQKVIMEMMKVAYATERKDAYTIELYRKKSMHFIINVFYFFTFFAPFVVIIWGLNKLHFSVLSIIIFLAFVSLISFAGVKIRERARELEIAEKRESPLMVFIDLFSLPLIQAGRWLSGQWARYNVILIMLNFLIDMPFQTFVEFLEQWRSFLKEKKEEIH